ncbi:MAG: cobalamin-binding protein [Steroidobacteraceae bacterium]|nr:cobalamin-binding protein [Steroidobacteraceae bacterium]
MSKRLLRECVGAILMLVMLAVLFPARASASVTVTDDSGRSLTLPHTPRKIISLAPGATEMLFAAGAGASVIATVEFSEEPPDARRIPRIGDANAIDIERVVALRPDVIVVWEGGNNPGQVTQLERLGIPLYRHRVERLDDLAASLRRLGALAGTPQVAETAAQRVESRIRGLARTYGGGSEETVLLQVWNRPIYTVGGSHIMTDALRLCGARNVFGDLQQKGPAVDTEAVIARNPQVIVAVAPPGVAREWLDEWKRYPSLRAVRNDALVAYEDSRLSRLGPSILDGTAVLCQAIARTRR